MDRNLHTDDFVRLLREKSDEFRMYPSKRIWYSIYNNIHPGRKWPSVAMTISLITALLLIGYLNTDHPASPSSRENTYAQVSNQNSPASLLYKPFDEYTGNKSKTTAEWKKNQDKNTVAINNPKVPLNNGMLVPGSKLSTDQQYVFIGVDPLTYSNTQKTGAVIRLDAGVIGEIKSTNLPATNLKSEEQDVIIQETIKTVYEADPITLLNSKKISRETIGASGYDNTSDKKLVSDDYKKHTETTIETINSQVANNNLTSGKSNVISAEDREWIENYALYNRPAPKKWAGKLAWQMYAAPSVVYRVLSTDPNFGMTSATAAPFVAGSNSSDINKDVIQKPSVGLEIGAGIQYSILKRLKLRTGLQLNYTRYNSHAFHNTHPVSTRLTMLNFESNSTYELYRTTPYSNKTGLDAVKLHNETFQVSIPFGADFKILGNENLQWNIGLSIQPTFVIGGNSYLISSDRRNYVKDNSMLNRWNLNAGIETFITYKSNGFTWQIGPQFRNQLFTTNNKKFVVEEKLANYGVKIGVSKNLK
ncbi:MAG: hypothetical protein ABIN67_01405 [Ferruginibacter sp.]